MMKKFNTPVLQHSITPVFTGSRNPAVQLSGSLVLSTRFNGNFFGSCLFDFGQRQAKYAVCQARINFFLID